MQLMDENYADAYELLESADRSTRFCKDFTFRLGKRLTPTEVHLIENVIQKIGKILDNLSNQNMSS